MDVLPKKLDKNYEEVLSKDLEKSCNVSKESKLSLEQKSNNDSLNELKNKIICSSKQTKDWRKQQPWYNNGKKNECEIFQRSLIEEIIGYKCVKSNYRLNLLSVEFKIYKCPMKNQDGFEWTEDFDGYIDKYKMVCSNGGAQTRSLREVYHFMNTQLNHLKNNINKNKIFFINILDGDMSHNHMDKFKYLISKKEYSTIKKYVFVGDMKNFYHWFNTQFTK